MPGSLPFLKTLQCMNFSNISDKGKKSLKQIQRIVQNLAGHSITFNTVSHKCFQDYLGWISNREEIAKCGKFSRKAERLDGFFFKNDDLDKKYQNLAIIFNLFSFWAMVKRALKEVSVWEQRFQNNNMTLTVIYHFKMSCKRSHESVSS